MNAHLPRTTPESQGVASADIERFISAIVPHEVHSIMVLKHGRVIAEGWWSPFEPTNPHTLYSLSKSFASLAVGLAVDDGLLDIESTVVSLLSDAAPDVISDNLAALRVRHLLTMTTGHSVDTMSPITKTDTHWARDILAQTIDHTPGTRFIYNSGATYLLSAIVQRVTGQRLLDYLTPRLLDPLGITGATWETCPLGVDIGGWGLSITTEDIAVFGQLVLQEGRWGDRQLVPAAWVRAATSAQVDNRDPDAPSKWASDDWMQGYGYQFWRCTHNAYRADGAFGQFAIGMPDQHALLVVTSGMSDTAAFLDTVWDTLVPALIDRPALPENPEANAALDTTLSTVQIPMPTGQTVSGLAGTASWALPANYAGVADVSVTIAEAGAIELTLHHSSGQRATLRAGIEHWERNGEESRLGGWAVAASGAWHSETTLAVRLQFVETPFALNLTLDVAADDIATLTVTQNVSFEQTELGSVTGEWAPA